MRCAPLLLLLASLLLGGCLAAEPVDEPFWVVEEISDGPPVRDLMQAALMAMVRAEFPPGEIDEAGGVATSGWDVHLAAYSNRGYRSQAVIEVEPGPAPRSYVLRARVRTQINAEIHEPLEPAKAKWEDRREDPARARVVMRQLLIQVTPRSGRGARRVVPDQPQTPR